MWTGTCRIFAAQVQREGKKKRWNSTDQRANNYPFVTSTVTIKDGPVGSFLDKILNQEYILYL